MAPLRLSGTKARPAKLIHQACFTKALHYHLNAEPKTQAKNQKLKTVF